MSDSNDLRPLTDLLASFEVRTTPFDPEEIWPAVEALIRGWKAAGIPVPVEAHAEWVAFALIEDYRTDGDFGWGTYYGPLCALPGADGSRIEQPSVAEITPEVLDHWERRVGSARHPLLRMRYGDVLWEFARRIKRPVHGDIARAVIDATLLAAVGGHFTDCHRGFPRFSRALDLALSIRDEQRVARVRDAIVAFDQTTAADAGNRCFAFDVLIEEGSRNVPLSPALVAKLVADLEARLVRAAQPKEGAALPAPWAVASVALRLARHYRRGGDEASMRRVLAAYGNAFGTAAERASLSLAMAWLEGVLKTYRSFGLTEEAEALEVRLRALGPAAMNEMQAISATTEIPAGEFERFVAVMAAGTLDEALARIAARFVPHKAVLAKQVRELAKAAPLGALFSQTILDWEGRPIATIGSLEEDFEGHLVRRASENMMLEAPWLRAVIDRVRERLAPTAAALRDHLLKSPVFDSRKAGILERGLAAYLDGDVMVAAPVLVPQVEDVLRNIVRLAGESTYKPRRQGGGLLLKVFDDLLREEAVEHALGEHGVHYFRALFTDQRGWNVRNDVCHGITPVHAFSVPMSDRVFHALLVLATLREARAAPVTTPP
jgi:hypothetical protein